MFEKTKARIAKFEEDHDSLRKVHQHVTDNKLVYAVVGTSAATFLVTKQFGGGPDVIQSFTNSTDNVATIINRSKNVDIVVKYLNTRNYNANACRCIETGQKFASQEEAAEAFNMASSILSKHLNGGFEHAKGFHFERM